MGSAAITGEEAGTSRLCLWEDNSSRSVSFTVPRQLEPGAAAAVSSSALPCATVGVKTNQLFCAAVAWCDTLVAS